MTPGEARRAYEALSPEAKERLGEYVTKIGEVIERVDQSLTDAGQRMADDTEEWLRETTK